MNLSHIAPGARGCPQTSANSREKVRTADTFSTLQIGYIVASDGQPMTGSERYYFDLLQKLPSFGVENMGLVVGEPGKKAPASKIEGFAPERGMRARERIGNLRRAVRRIEPQVSLVVTHSPEHALPVLDLIRRKPLVVHFHGPRTLEYVAEGKSFRRIAMAQIAETLTYARAVRFVVLSEANAKILRERYRIAPERISIVPGAVDTTQFRPAVSRAEARAKLGWPQNRPIVTAVRRLAHTKGLENLIDAIALVKARMPQAYFPIVGAGPLLEALRARADALGLADHVLFAGQIHEDLPLAYRAANFSIVPSVQLEGFGLSVVESLACGTPALVTPVTGLPEVVRDLDEGLILSGTSPEDLANGIVAALSHPERLPSEDACLEYVQRFAWNSIAARIKMVYEDVLQRAE